MRIEKNKLLEFISFCLMWIVICSSLFPSENQDEEKLEYLLRSPRTDSWVKNKDYSIGNLYDLDLTTTWKTSKNGGIGEKIFRLTSLDRGIFNRQAIPYYPIGFYLINGSGASLESYLAFNRIRELKLTAYHMSADITPSEANVILKPRKLFVTNVTFQDQFGLTNSFFFDVTNIPLGILSNSKVKHQPFIGFVLTVKSVYYGKTNELHVAELMGISGSQGVDPSEYTFW